MATTYVLNQVPIIRNFKTFLYEIDGQVAVITLNRPKQLNPFGLTTYEELAVAVRDAEFDSNVKAVIITGQGRFFSAGADVLDRPKTEPTIGDVAASVDFYRTKFNRTIYTLGDVLGNCTKILIFALNGPAVGISGALIAHADFVYSTPKAYVHIPFAELCISCEGGSSLMLAERIGMAKAAEMLLYSKKMNAEELKSCGFINEIFDEDGFDSAVRNYVKSNIKHANASSLIAIKTLMRKHLSDRLNTALRDEVLVLSRRFASGEPQKAFAALMAKHLKSKV